MTLCSMCVICYTCDELITKIKDQWHDQLDRSMALHDSSLQLRWFRIAQYYCSSPDSLHPCIQCGVHALHTLPLWTVWRSILIAHMRNMMNWRAVLYAQPHQCLLESSMYALQQESISNISHHIGYALLLITCLTVYRPCDTITNTIRYDTILTRAKTAIWATRKLRELSAEVTRVLSTIPDQIILIHH